MATIFSKIINKEIPSDMVYQDEHVTAFRDIERQAPVHMLIVPNKEIPTVNDIAEEDEKLVGRMFTVARKIAAEEGVARGHQAVGVGDRRFEQAALGVEVEQPRAELVADPQVAVPTPLERFGVDVRAREHPLGGPLVDDREPDDPVGVAELDE